MPLLSNFFSGNDRLTRALTKTHAIAMGEGNKEAVRLIQMALLALGHAMPKSIEPNGTLDGIFGAETHHAVVSFQKKNKLVPDGVVGSQTLGSMDVQVKGILPEPPPDLGKFKSLPTSYFIPRPVPQLKQPDSASCWATSATILFRWNNQNDDQFVDQWNAVEQIEWVLGKADTKLTGKSPGHFIGEFKKGKGLRTGDNERLYSQGLNFTKFIPPMSRFSDPFNYFKGAYAWMGVLYWAKRPVAANVLSFKHLWNHWLIITGVDLKTSMANRYAPPSEYPFLNIGIVHYFDPYTKSQAIMSAEDIDFLVGPLPSFASTADQYRVRVFF